MKEQLGVTHFLLTMMSRARLEPAPWFVHKARTARPTVNIGDFYTSRIFTGIYDTKIALSSAIYSNPF